MFKLSSMWEGAGRKLAFGVISFWILGLALKGAGWLIDEAASAFYLHVLGKVFPSESMDAAMDWIESILSNPFVLGLLTMAVLVFCAPFVTWMTERIRGRNAIRFTDVYVLYNSSLRAAMDGAYATLVLLTTRIAQGSPSPLATMATEANPGATERARETSRRLHRVLSDLDQADGETTQHLVANCWNEYRLQMGYIAKYARIAETLGFRLEEQQTFKDWLVNHHRFVDELRKLGARPEFRILSERIKGDGWDLASQRAIDDIAARAQAVVGPAQKEPR